MKLGYFILRYVLAVLVVFSLPTMYFIFKPVTLGLSVFFLSIFFKEVSFSLNFIHVGSFSFELISACIAGSAYLLLLLLNLLTPGIKFYKRIFLFLVSAGIFLVLNVIRLIVSISIFISRNELFNETHLVFWYASVFFVVIIWFLCVLIFKIREVPVYSDIIQLVKTMKSKN